MNHPEYLGSMNCFSSGSALRICAPGPFESSFEELEIKANQAWPVLRVEGAGHREGCFMFLDKSFSV